MAEEKKYKESFFDGKMKSKLDFHQKGLDLYVEKLRKNRMRKEQIKITPNINKKNSVNKAINKLIKNILKYLVIIISIASTTSGTNMPRSLNSKLISITLKVNKIRSRKFFYYHFFRYPNNIKINGDSQPTISNSYTLNTSNNAIELIWDNNLDFTTKMFYQCFDIYEIDFSDRGQKITQDNTWAK